MRVCVFGGFRGNLVVGDWWWWGVCFPGGLVWLVVVVGLFRYVVVCLIVLIGLFCGGGLGFVVRFVCFRC